MIIKVKNSGGSWSYFECQIVHSHKCLLGTVENKGHYVILLKDKDRKDDLNVTLLNLETEKSHFRKILTDQVCYILNNEGKTVDRI